MLNLQLHVPHSFYCFTYPLTAVVACRHHAGLQSRECAAHHHGTSHILLFSVFPFESSLSDVDFLSPSLTDCFVIQEMLFDLAGAAGLEQKRAAMAAGQRINVTEDRAVMHIALRAPRTKQLMVDGADVVPDVHAVLSKVLTPQCRYCYHYSIVACQATQFAIFFVRSPASQRR